MLADVFESFRSNNFKKCGLCAGHYFSAPALTWDSIFNMKKVELELIAYADMYLFFEKGMRSGVSNVSKTFNKANNKYLKSYDVKQELKHIIYLDVNSLYGCTMYKFLPTSRFKWIDPKEIFFCFFSSRT